MDKVKKQSQAAEAVIIGLKLLLICSVVALIMSLVYSVTKEPYEKNLTEQKRQAIVEIFQCDSVSYSVMEQETDSTGVLYEVKNGDTLLGYCVEIASPGFGGDINLTVGYHADGSILGVGIVSLNETPGLGAKVNDASYLSQYEGKNGQLNLKEDVDAITGATISSKAVLEGVNRATRLLSEVLSQGGLS